MEKWEIQPPHPEKPLNRSSPKFAWVIMSGTPTPMQNFNTIWLPPFAPTYAKITRLLVLPSAYNQDPCTDFHDQYVKWRRFAQVCAFWGSRKQNFTFRSHFRFFAQNLQIFGQFLKVKFRVKKALTIAMLTCKLPLIVIVGPWKL